MPNSPDFASSFIYKITSPETTDVYIGSATTNLKLRLAQHRNHYDRWLRGEGKFLSSFYVMDCSGWKLEKIEDYPCEDMEALRTREGEWIRTTPNCCNFKVAGRKADEWKKLPEVKKRENARRKKNYNEEAKKKKKEYYELHKEKKQAYARKYYEDHKDYFKNYMADYKTKKNALIGAGKNVASQQSVNEFFEGNA